MQRCLAVSLSLVVAACLGCSSGESLPPNYKTTVEITYKGEPVSDAMVTLRPDGHESPAATGVTGADGKVQLFSYKGKGDGVIPGNYLVGVEKQKVEKTKVMSEDDPNYGKDVSEEETQKERVDLLPAKYISAAKSGLTCTVTEDATKNVFTFNLED